MAELSSCNNDHEPQSLKYLLSGISWKKFTDFCSKVTDRSNIFKNLLNKACNELYPGYSEFSSSNFLVKLMHVKVLNGWSNKLFDMLLELLRATFPMCSTTIPSSFYEAKRKFRDLNLGYETIHVCKYDCVLYWKEFADLQHCPTCGEARYKVNHNRGKKFRKRYCTTFFWYLDYIACLYRRKGLLT